MPPPNWENPAEYPDPASASLHRWAWEFLRRNPTFCEEHAAARGELVALKERPRFTSDRPDVIVLQRWGIDFPLLKEWYDKGMLDAPVKFALAPRDLAHVKHNGVRIVAAPERTDRRALEFDLGAPIEPQLERARAMLLASQKHEFPTLTRKRNRLDRFPIYLRLLDAIDAGATQRQMVEGLQSMDGALDERTIRRWIRVARGMRDAGYRDLLRQ